MNRLVLIDGNAIMHRAYHALPPMSAPDGRPAHVVYGFISVIIRLFHDLKPSHMAVTFDRPGPTFRNELLATYQAQRPKMEDDFISQIQIVHDAVRAFGIPSYEADGFEADDVIGTICDEAVQSRSGNKRSGISQVVIVTGDRDILQLVRNDSVLVFMPTKGLSEGMLYAEKDVLQRMGVLPDKIPELKALMGDSSDNYSGIPGIGPKTAITLIGKYESVERLYAHTALIQPASVRDKVEKGKESAILSKTLATIRRDAPIEFRESDARIDTLDRPEAMDFLTAMHFPSLIKRIRPDVVPKRSATPKTQKAVHDDKDAQQSLF